MSRARETDVMNEIRLALSGHGYACFRCNVGSVKLPDGRVFQTGLPKGHSDLVAYKNGRAYFIEVKVKPNRPTPEQLRFLETMRIRYGCAGGVAYSAEDAVRICEGGYENA